MYAQTTIIRVPMGAMSELRRLIEHEYLPVVQQRTGFIAAYLLEQVDDPDYAEMIQFWDTQNALEEFNRTGLLASSVQVLSARIPGLQIRRQGYVVRVAIGATVEQAASAKR